MFAETVYPANAVATKESTVIRLAKGRFFELLKDNPEIHFKVTAALAERLVYKATMASEISVNPPDHRILQLLGYLKKSVYKIEGKYNYQVELTRQQIADLTGLRVETVIRTIKKLQQKKKLLIRERKIYF